MARIQNKRGMGRLLKEMRTNPVAAVVNGVAGIGSIVGTGVAVVLGAMRKVAPDQTRQAASQGHLQIYRYLAVIVMLLAGIGLLLFALVQITTTLRVFSRGMVWRRFGNKRVIFWVEVEHFGRGDAAPESLTSWSLLLRSGERIILHAGLYNRGEFAETMELIAEQIEETHKQFG